MDISATPGAAGRPASDQVDWATTWTFMNLITHSLPCEPPRKSLQVGLVDRPCFIHALHRGVVPEFAVACRVLEAARIGMGTLSRPISLHELD